METKQLGKIKVTMLKANNSMLYDSFLKSFVQAKKVCGLIIGHNWGSEHDPDTPGCAPGVEKGGKYLMYPYSVSGYEHNNQVSI